MADYNDIYASTVYLFTRKTVTANPKVVEAIIRAHTEAIKRFYEDKAFAVKAYTQNDKVADADVERIYDMIGQMQLPQRLRDVGVQEADIPHLAQVALQSLQVQALPRVPPPKHWPRTSLIALQCGFGIDR